MKISEILLEGSGEVNLARRLKTKLSREAEYAIDSWESMNWVDGDLSSAYSKKNDVYREIEKAGEPIRAAIRQREGDSITLYRGIKKKTMDAARHGNRAIYSWTTRPRLAAVFADLAIMKGRDEIQLHRDRKGPFKIFIGITDQQAEQVEQKVQQEGKAKLGNFLLRRWKDDKKWTTVYLKTNRGIKEYDYSVETDRIAEWFKSRREENEKDHNQEDEGFVVSKNIPVDDIVWVLNASGSMEYIVKGHSGLDGEKVNL